MTPDKEFRRFAQSYRRYNLIQARVATALANKIPHNNYPRIIDLGCGSGGFFNAYQHPFVSYLAIDIAPEMVAIHPIQKGVETMLGDFNDPALFRELKKRKFDLLVSSSALQWSQNLDWTLAQIADLKRPVALALFTSGTFAELHKIAGISSPIRSRDETIRLLQKHFNLTIDILRYRLYFRDTLSMLRYIKRSGVSGGMRQLSVTQTRHILTHYPLSYLQFEVVTAVGK